MTVSKWWYLDLHADFPEIEMYYGGWKAQQELDTIELGDRVMNEEAAWMFTWIYSTPRDRLWAGVGYMVRAVLQRMRDDGMDPQGIEDIPPGWCPDFAYWDGGKP